MPVFVHAQGLQTEWVPFHVVAGLAHLGDDPNSGHCRAALFHSGQMLLANIYLLWRVPLEERNRLTWSRPLPSIAPDAIALIADQLAR